MTIRNTTAIAAVNVMAEECGTYTVTYINCDSGKQMFFSCTDLDDVTVVLQNFFLHCRQRASELRHLHEAAPAKETDPADDSIKRRRGN